jgi:MFS family permease
VLYTASTAIVSHAFPPEERGRAIGLLFSANGIGLAIGPVAGGLLVGALGWRWVFLLNVPLIVLSLALCHGHVQESRAETQEGEGLDLPGLLLLMTSLPLCLLAIGFGQEWGWWSSRTLGTALAGVLLLALLVRIERRSRFPLVRFDLFTRQPFVLASLASGALAFFYCAAFFLMPLFLQQVRGASDTAIGWLLLPTTAVMALVSPWAGRWVDRVGTRTPLLCGFLALGLSALLQTRFDAGPGWSVEMAAFVLMGVGWGLILGPSTVAALAAVPAQLSGVATGAAWTLHNFGGALGLTIATVVFGWGAGVDAGAGAGSPPDAAAFLGGYRAAMAVLVAVCVALLVLLGATRTGPPRPSAMDVEMR